MNLDKLRTKILNWINSEHDIIAVCLVGSYARQELTNESDSDIMIPCADPNKFISNNEWIHYFGQVNEKKFEVLLFPFINIFKIISE